MPMLSELQIYHRTALTLIVVGVAVGLLIGFL